MSTSRVDLTPSWIAERLLTSDASSDDRAIVKAMAEQSIALHEATAHSEELESKLSRTRLGAFFAIERAMVSAAQQVIAQHNIRCARAWKWIESLDDEPDDEPDYDEEAFCGVLGLGNRGEG